MLKKTMLIGVMCISLLGISQTQCSGTTKQNVQCKQTTKSKSGMCHNHDPNYKKKEVYPTVICSGTTKKNTPCKSKTKDISGKCHNHRKNNQ